MPKILIGLPTYDSKIDARLSLYLFSARRDNLTTDVRTRQLSALCWCFNTLWVEALNDKTYDYFLLIHADIIPCAPTGWISKLISEAQNARADLISVLSPIKNRDGLTSTALQTAEHTGGRRISMHEAIHLPQTFKAADVAKVFGWESDTRPELLINTGCMLMDLRTKRAQWEEMYFKTIDRIERQNGKFVSTFVPEDWDFSRQAHARGLTVAATRAIRLIHNGNADYGNDTAWGEVITDTAAGMKQL